MEKVGKYQILEKLGQGGMGVVYKALDTLIERVVAVKMVSTNLNLDPELRARFFREGRAAGQLSHKNIVTVFDLGEDNGTAYIAMELLEGEDLRARILKGDPMELARKVQIMAEVCEGLAHAHERNVIHRDIKPANIFITRAGLVKVLDFGLARTMSSDLTTSGQAMGTVNYMSPEQVRGEKVDNRTDIFSVGVTFYELLTHRKAFQGDSFTSTIFKILQDDPEPIEQFDPTIPPELCAVVYKALAKDREQRYGTLGEIVRDLGTIYGATQTELPTLVTIPDLRQPENKELRAHAKVAAPVGGKSRGLPERGAPRVSGSRIAAKSERSGSQKGAHPGLQDADETKSGAREALSAVASEAEPGSPLASSRFRRYFGIGMVATAALAGLLWAAIHYWPGMGLKSGTNHAAELAPVPSPAAVRLPPVPDASKDQSQPPTTVAEGISADLATASTELKSHKYSDAAREAEHVLKDFPENPEARSILQKARESLESIRTGIRNARSYMAAGDYRRARAVTGEVLVLEPSNGEALQLARQLDQWARAGAEKSLAQMRDAKSKAEAARTSELAPQSLSAARSRDEEANSLFAGGKFDEAAARFAEASDLYRRAESDARAEGATRTEISRKAESEQQQALLRIKGDTARQGYDREREVATQAGAKDKARDQFGGAEKVANSARLKWDAGDFDGAARDYESAASAMRQANNLALEAIRKEAARLPEPSKPVVPVAAGQPESGSRETMESVQKGIGGALEQYKAAMEGKNLSLLKTVWPALGTQQEQAISKQWAYTRSLRIVLQNIKVEKLEGQSAVVTVHLHNEQQVDTGASRKYDQRATFNMARRGRNWFIETAGFEVMR